MLGAIAFILAVKWLASKNDPATRDPKRRAALAAAAQAGILPYAKSLRPSGAGFVFYVSPRDHRQFMALLEADAPGAPANANGDRPLAFLSGSFYWMHANEVGCKNFGQCRDYRSPNGLIGPGSLQVVYNRETGQGFFDYDRVNPYQSWFHLAKHAEEI